MTEATEHLESGAADEDDFREIEHDNYAGPDQLMALALEQIGPLRDDAPVKNQGHPVSV